MTYDADRLSPPGPIVSVIIHPPLNDPRASSGLAQLDTGADMTVISDAVVDELQLVPEYSMLVGGYDGSTVERNCYLVTLEVAGEILDSLEVIAAPLDLMILGRDVLNHFNITLNGRELTFEMQAA